MLFVLALYMIVGSYSLKWCLKRVLISNTLTTGLRRLHSNSKRNKRLSVSLVSDIIECQINGQNDSKTPVLGSKSSKVKYAEQTSFPVTFSQQSLGKNCAIKSFSNLLFKSTLKSRFCKSRKNYHVLHRW